MPTQHEKKYNDLVEQLSATQLYTQKSYIEKYVARIDVLTTSLEEYENLNNIPLHKWDRCPTIRWPFTFHLTQAEKVSLLKHIARLMVEETDGA